jgi:cell division septation protein DedD
MRRRLGSAGLGYGQVFVLILGFLLTSGLIFLFGFLVGQRRTEWLLAREERVVRKDMPAQPTAGPEEQGGGVDLAFYESMKEKAYRRMQESDAATPTQPRGAGSTLAPAVLAAPPTVTPARVAAKPAGPAAPRRTPAAAGTEWADAGWTVQVNATTNPQQARDLARTLKAKGYDAYTVQAPLRGQTWYRVRVGRFDNRDKARDMESRLKTREGMENAYVTPQ